MKRPLPSLRPRSALPALLAALLSCAAPAQPRAHTPAAAAAATPNAPAGPAGTAAAAALATPPAPLPDTPAARQLGAWLAAFNSQQREALLAYHEQHFPYSAASADLSNPEREHGLSVGTGGFDVIRVEQSEPEQLVALLKERNSPQHARVRLRVAAEAPHPVSKLHIGPVPTPHELLSPAERQARTMDAAKRRAVLASIAQQLDAHYVYLESARLVNEGLQKKLARGDYDRLTDAAEFADAVARDLKRLSRDRHMGLRFGPMPQKPDLQADAPPDAARRGYGFGPSQRLRGNVAVLVINGFPPPFPQQKAAIAERMSEVADADALIVDLRGNNGGFPPTEVLVASYFFDEQPVLLKRIHRRDVDQTHEIWTERELPGKRIGSRKPVYVLTGEHTFSGGEALAYELQALGRARVVGENTKGGAHASFPYPVEGGFVLRVPTMRSSNAITGTNWESIGIIPDVYVPEEDALERAHELALEQLGRK